jgi:hypothetical protein
MDGKLEYEFRLLKEIGVFFNKRSGRLFQNPGQRLGNLPVRTPEV